MYCTSIHPFKTNGNNLGMRFSSILKPSTNICENIKTCSNIKTNTKMGKFSLLIVLLLNF